MGLVGIYLGVMAIDFNLLSGLELVGVYLVGAAWLAFSVGVGAGLVRRGG